MQTLLTLFTAIAVLICPYICAVNEAVAHAAGLPQAKACCQHCQTTQSTSGQLPVAPEQSPEQDTRTCVCAGAICSTVERVGIEIAVQADGWICQLDSLSLQDSRNPLASVDPAGLPPPWQGLQRRIALHSLQI